LGTRLSIGGNGARVVIGFHHDQSWAKYHQKCEYIAHPGVSHFVPARRRSELINGDIVRITIHGLPSFISRRQYDPFIHWLYRPNVFKLRYFYAHDLLPGWFDKMTRAPLEAAPS
jgi:hypothetical protein